MELEETKHLLMKTIFGEMTNLIQYLGQNNGSDPEVLCQESRPG